MWHYQQPTSIHSLSQNSNLAFLFAVDGLVASDEGQIGLGGDIRLTTEPLEILNAHLCHKILSKHKIMTAFVHPSSKHSNTLLYTSPRYFTLIGLTTLHSLHFSHYFTIQHITLHFYTT